MSIKFNVLSKLFTTNLALNVFVDVNVMIQFYTLFNYICSLYFRYVCFKIVVEDCSFGAIYKDSYAKSKEIP